MNSQSEHRKRQRSRRDKAIRVTVTGFGALVLVTLVVLIFHLISQALPLAMVPALEREHAVPLPDGAEVVAVDDLLEGQSLILTGKPCQLAFYQLNDEQLQRTAHYTRPCSHELSVLGSAGQNVIADISSGGQARLITARSIPQPGVSLAPVQAVGHNTQPSGRAVVSFSLPDDMWQSRTKSKAWLTENWAVIGVADTQQKLLRWVNRHDPTQRFDQHFPVSETVVPLGDAKQTLVIKDNLLRFDFLTRPGGYNARVAAPVSWWFVLPKQRSLLLGNDQGQITRWTLRNNGGALQFAPTYTIELNAGETPVDVTVHASSNAMAILTSQQRLLFINRVTGEVVSDYSLKGEVTTISWYGDRIYGASANTLYIWSVAYLSGITTWDALFSPQQYEGYAEPDAVWQTTSASDYQEAKFSLTPLLIGSAKASLLALTIALPMSIGAAVYTAYFARSRMRHILKPTIEMLEAIPSVLIGFIAAIWLAPLAEQFLFSFAFFLVTVPLGLLLITLIQHRLADLLPITVRPGSEILFALAGIVVLGYISVMWAPQWVNLLFDTQGVSALAESTGSPIGKTTVVVAIALGVAISPSIYSLAEDAISGVPDHLKHASFALGATRLQTLIHVVLHVALPGILAAVMLGFGRAFGETMIVLMVTGNTPVSSWSLLEGLRALTANLAIELPEADLSSAHYQILFFTACILFAFTFVVNTLAELLRQRLRRSAYLG
ncbi:ABC transporter permease subunit [Alteromonas sp. ASW11-19]|uniref:ABC transporter permease subunit n=1 Tax=Alteromonas salexigens TaxID=2982530 RepID=A0ABT2VJ11_9ALTE|nr:ABC transporter permease subunit [Alteromonas salexigens]MCU7553175.1 ABC transporter permease subunit [Alteromonas salexigens]